jgi:hypothetical protein
MRFLQALYRTFNFLSLDVVAGAVCSALFFAKVYHTALVSNGALILALTVWIIYSLDHLLDAARMHGKASTGRHIFHQRYFHLILVAVIVAVVVVMILISNLPTFVVMRGVVAGTVVAGYLVAQKQLYAIKELIAGVLYCAGILVPLEELNAGMPALITFQFFCVVLMNLLLFSWFDLDKDVRQKTLSAVAIIGRSRSQWAIIALFGVEFAIALYAGFQRPALIVVIMGALHLVIMAFDQFFQSRERYRAFADGLFFLPVLYLL